MRIQQLLVFICIIFSSCSQNADKISQSHIIDIDNAITKDQLLYSAIFGKMKTIILETSDESLISFIHKMEVYNDYIIILDSQSAKSVFLFTKEGKFIKKVGAFGSGPGEFTSPCDFTIDTKNGDIYILDLRSQNILKYHISSGKYLSTINLGKKDGNNISRICYVDGILYTDAAFDYKSSSNYLMQAINSSSGKQKEIYFTTEYTNKGWHDIFTISSQSFFYTGKQYLFNQHFMDTVVSLTPQVHSFLIIQGKELISQNDLAKFVNTDHDIHRKINKIRHLTDFIEYKDFIFFHYVQGFFRKNIVYNTQSGKTYQYKKITNDFIFKTSNYPIPRMGFIASEGIYTFYDIHGIDELIISAAEGTCSDKLDKKEEIAKLNEDTNPIIFYFEYKD